MRKSVIPSRMKYGVYRSPHIFYLTGVQGRFLASLEMTIPGKAVLSFSALETLFSPLSFIPPVPYPPLRGTFPSRGRLCPSLSVSPHILAYTCIHSDYIGLWLPCLHSVQTKTALRGLALQSGFWFYYSTVTDFARFLGLSTSFPLLIEV